MTTKPIGLRQSIAFGEDFELDLRPRRLRHGSHVLKLERIPLEILLLLLDHPGEVVTREEIVARIWGKDVFLDTDNSIRGAIRKIRQVLRDDPEAPRFVQTVTGRGYRFIAPVVGRPEDNSTSTVVSAPKEENEPEAEASVHPAGRPRTRNSAFGALAGSRPGGGTCTCACDRLLVRKNRHTDATPPKIRSLAVLPLKNLSGDQAQEYLADGMTEELIGRLRRHPRPSGYFPHVGDALQGHPACSP